MFITEKEVRLINSLTKEIHQEVVGQKIIYYAVSEERTKTDDLYDEAIRKVTHRPVEINARVLFEDPEQTVTQFTQDTVHKIEVYLHQDELRERNVIPREGDFIKFGHILYEILQLTKPQIVYGQMENAVQVKLVAQSSRSSNIEVLDSIQGI
jgi:hypothetical protein